MVQRKTVPVENDCAITVVTEQMSDGRWAVVASVKHFSRRAEQTIDLPVPDERFASQGEAEEFGVRTAREWIEGNRAHAA